MKDLKKLSGSIVLDRETQKSISGGNEYGCCPAGTCFDVVSETCVPMNQRPMPKCVA